MLFLAAQAEPPFMLFLAAQAEPPFMLFLAAQAEPPVIPLFDFLSTMIFKAIIIY
jgi:hypothetical protein